MLPALDEFDLGLSFDAIVCMDVIEHMPSPRVLLAHLLARLATGGTLIVTTGDAGNLLWRVLGARWWYCYYPEQIAFISERWLRFHAPAPGAQLRSVERFNYLDAPAQGAARRWQALLKYLLMPARHERRRAQQLQRYGHDRGVPGLGLTRDHLLVTLAR